MQVNRWTSPGGWRVRAAACMALALTMCTPRSMATQITLRDGTVLRGTVEQRNGTILLTDGLRRVLFSSKRLAHIEEGDDPATAVKPFRIRQPLGGRSRTQAVDKLVSIIRITPFNDQGRRTLVARDPVRGQVEIAQGITRIGPDYVQVQSLNYLWDSRIATRAIPPRTIDAVLRQAIDPNHVDDRFRLVRFYISMGWFKPAERELARIKEQFPAVASQVEEAGKVLDQMKARRGLQEIKLRRRAGQHAFAYHFLRNFDTEGAPGEVLVEVRQLLREYEQTIDRMERVQQSLERAWKELPESDQKAEAEEPVGYILRSLHVENLERLERFLESEDAKPAQRVALAISGWVAGSAFAEPNLERALLLWQARRKMQQFLAASSPNDRDTLLDQLRTMEYLTVEVAAQMIRYLPPLLEERRIKPRQPTRLTAAGFGPEPIRYWVLLPDEYSGHHRHPVLMVLRGGALSPEQEIEFWSSPPAYQASRYGYIVVAPEYVPAGASKYDYGAAAHQAVLATLVDVRRRFSVDSDRVFLAGHSMGGQAAWDIGLAHPDLFAGVISISGTPKYFSQHYWPNAQHAALYVVVGEKDGNSPEENLLVLNRLMARGYDARYVEFIGRGHEGFSDELLRLYQWMEHRRRHRFPLDFSCRSARPCDNEFYWISVGDFLPTVMMDPRVFDRKRIRPARLEGKIVGVSNSIFLDLRGPTSADLWLSPEMIDYDRPLTVRLNGSVVYRRRAPRDLGVLLEDFLERADREKLFYGKLGFPRL